MAEIATKPVGCGPFTFVSYAPGDKLEMARFDDYYEEDKPYLDKVTVKVLPDPQAQLANLSPARSTSSPSVPLADIRALEADANLQLVKYPAGGVWNVVLMNCKKPPLDNKLVRQALNYTVDREKINELAYFGQFIPTQTRYLPDVPWYSPEADAIYSYDIDKAKALLAEAGFRGRVRDDAGRLQRHPRQQGDGAGLGAGPGEGRGRRRRSRSATRRSSSTTTSPANFDLQAYTLGDGTLDPATYLANNSPLRTENNTCGIETQPFFAEYKQLLEEGASSIDPAVRKPIYDRVQVLSAEEGWVINLAFTQDALALSTSGSRATNRTSPRSPTWAASGSRSSETATVSGRTAWCHASAHVRRRVQVRTFAEVRMAHSRRGCAGDPGALFDLGRDLLVHPLDPRRSRRLDRRAERDARAGRDAAPSVRAGPAAGRRST